MSAAYNTGFYIFTSIEQLDAGVLGYFDESVIISITGQLPFFRPPQNINERNCQYDYHVETPTLLFSRIFKI